MIRRGSEALSAVPWMRSQARATLRASDAVRERQAEVIPAGRVRGPADSHRTGRAAGAVCWLPDRTFDQTGPTNSGGSNGHQIRLQPDGSGAFSSGGPPGQDRRSRASATESGRLRVGTTTAVARCQRPWRRPWEGWHWPAAPYPCRQLWLARRGRWQESCTQLFSLTRTLSCPPVDPVSVAWDGSNAVGAVTGVGCGCRLRAASLLLVRSAG